MDELICIAPEDIGDADLWAYLEGMATDNIVEHIDACAFCQQELRSLIKMNFVLHHAAYRADCPDTAVLWKYAHGLIDKSSPVAIHIDDCPHCQQEVQLTMDTSIVPKPLSQASGSFLPPDSLYQKGKKYVQAILAPVSLSPSFSFRGQSEKQQTYQADEYQIMIVRIPRSPIEDIWQVEGQILLTKNPDELFEGVVSVIEDGAEVVQSQINEVGYFELDDLKPGNYILELELPSFTIFIPDFQIP